MNYEEKYKEALKIMESLHSVVKYQSSSDALLVSQTIEKAFHELRESEDEKIRKEIISYIKSSAAVTNKDWIAWLEKQGEHEPSWSEEDEKFINYAISLTDDAQIKNFLKSLKDRVQPQHKQEWNEEDEKRVNSIISSIEYCSEQYPDRKEYAKDINWLKSLKPQPKQEWSKEDETGWINTKIMIKDFASHHYTKDSIKLVIDWLESIKYRIQSKQ